MLYRRYGHLQSRLLLEKQENLRRLELDLEKMDIKQTSADADKDDLNTWDMEEEKASERDQLMKEIEAAFREYGERDGQRVRCISNDVK